jgi:hypothetical protein
MALLITTVGDLRREELYPAELTGIHVNFAEQAIEFEDRQGTIGRLRFTGETVLYEGQPLLLLPTDPDTREVRTPPPVSEPPPAPCTVRRSAHQRPTRHARP